MHFADVYLYHHHHEGERIRSLIHLVAYLKAPPHALASFPCPVPVDVGSKAPSTLGGDNTRFAAANKGLVPFG